MKFEVPGKPGAWARAGSDPKTGHRYTPKGMAAYKTKVLLCAKAAGVPLLEGPVQICITAYWEWPKSMHRKREPREGCFWDGGPDGDNIVKNIFDALNGIAYHDDRQVAMHTCTKRRCAQGEAARCEIFVGPLLTKEAPTA